MSNERPDNNRRLLPRWHASDSAVKSGELQSLFKGNKAARLPIVSAEYEQLKLRWMHERSVELAADIVSCAISLCRSTENEVIEAASFILAEDDSPILTGISQSVLNGLVGEVSSSGSFSAVGVQTKSLLYAQIAYQKSKIRYFPRNAIAWMDLARLYTSVGQQSKAKNAVSIAIALAPDNRFILRSGARFYAHSHRHQDGDSLAEGLHILRRSPLIRVDPWIMAAEISMATLGNYSPKSIKAARDISDADRYSPWDLSELNGALATLVIFGGGKGNPNKLFGKSLRRPTENALAQAQWASKEHHLAKVPDAKFSEVPLGAPEALALKYQAEKEWHKVIEQCRAWSAMEPTSTRPLIMGSFIAEVALEDGEIALEFAEKACIIAPNESFSYNNAAVALAYLGRLDEAEMYAAKNGSKDLESKVQAVHYATLGLISYRRGRTDEGRSLYIKAVDIAKKLNDQWLRAMSLWHMLREESKIRNPDIRNLVDILWKRTSGLHIPEIEPLRDRILSYKPSVAQRVDELISSARGGSTSSYLGRDFLSDMSS